MAHLPLAAVSRAVLIGVPEYENSEDFSNIPSARTNVDRLREVLTDRTLGRMLPPAVEILTEPRTRDRALDLLRTGIAQAEDLLLVYFTGHGYVDLSGGEPELYLMTRKSTKGGAQLNGIRYSALLEQLAKSRAKRVVLILDCCYSGNAAAQVPLPDRAFSLITASKPLSLIYKGDGMAPTPFTAALIKALREGTDPREPVTVMSLGRRLSELAAADAKSIDPKADYDAWDPRELSSGGAGDTVLSTAREHDRGDRRQRVTARTWQALRRFAGYVGFCVSWAAGPGQPVWHRAIGGVMSLVLLTGGVLGFVKATEPLPLCPTPLELRVMTSPETRDALASVLDTFQRQSTQPLGGRPSGCGQLNITVQAAGSDQVVGAFQNSAAWARPELACPDSTPSCPEPLRDVGAHPDVWIPAASSEYQRALAATQRPESAATFGLPLAIADSPAVLAAPNELIGRPRTGQRIEDLVKAARGEGMDVRRSAPQSSDAALAHALHLSAQGAQVQGVPPTDDSTLLCDLAPGQALLISEQTTLALDDTGLDSRPSCLDNSSYHVPYYPSDVPPLDLTFVPVTWQNAHGDSAQRATAVSRLADWLRSGRGRCALDAQGFRVPGRSALHCPADSPLHRLGFADDPHVSVKLPSTAAINQLMSTYGQSGKRRTVLFAVDVSTSSYSGANVNTINSVLRKAISSLGPGDHYGIAGVPGALGDAGPAKPLPLGPHSAADGSAGVDALRAVDADAPIYDTISSWTAQLAKDHGGTPLLVLITDDEDSKGIGQPPTSDVPVAVVSTEDVGCKLPFNATLTSKIGACVDASQDLAGRRVDAIGRLTAGSAG